jgi:hypothetical protein
MCGNLFYDSRGCIPNLPLHAQYFRSFYLHVINKR